MTRATIRQAALFLVIGGLSALIDAGVFWILIQVGVTPWLASGLSFLAAFAVNYNGNRKVVFRAAHSHGAIWRYCALVALNLAVSAGGVAALVAVGLPPLAAKLVTMVVIAIVNFVVMRLWVFPQRAGQQDSEPAPPRP